MRILRIAPVVACVSILGCGDAQGGARGEPVLVTQGLGMSWARLSHRVSVLEVDLVPGADGYVDATAVAENHGGTFGAIDMPGATVSALNLAHPRVAYDRVSVWVEIPPGSTDAGESFAATQAVSQRSSRLAGAQTVVGLIAGYRVDTNRYPTPPAFASDPTYPYDPKDGFTSQGFGVRVSTVAIDGDRLDFSVRARNSLGVSDRPDMNAAIPLATSWVRVDVLLVGLWGDAVSSDASIAYFLDDPTYGDHAGPAHADAATRALHIDGTDGYGTGFVGLRAFDFYVNAPGHISPTCVVTQDAVNSWGDMVSGPGRYLREADASLSDFTYDAATGAADVQVELYASTHSNFYEEGNLCFEGRATVALVQLADAPPTPPSTVSKSFAFFSGEPWSEPFP